MKKIVIVATFALASVLGGSVGAQNGAGTTTGTHSAPLPGRIVLPNSRDGVGSRIRTDRARYAPGQAVQMAFTVKNTTNKTVNYDFSSGQQYDFAVQNAEGKEVWRWSKGRMFTESLTHFALAPGKSVTFRASWSGRDAQGRPAPSASYTVSARLPFSSRPAITGGIVVGRETDPNNMGFPTRSPADNGAVRQVNVAAPVSASTRITIGGPPANKRR